MMTMPTVNRNGSSWIAQPMANQYDDDDDDDIYSQESSPAPSVYSDEEPQHIIDNPSSDDGNHHPPHTRQQQPRRRNQESPPTTTRPRPPPRSSRRASIGGTTLYNTPDMAKMDTFLRSSGLRLKPDGTCQFLFETTRFVIETTTDVEEGGEFLLYCSLGKLRDLRENFGRSQRTLLKMLALWNEELQMDGNDDTGLLRIDSSKEDGPHVSFIYYGQMRNISSAEKFQQLLDEFVDDALEFFDRLNTVDVEGEPVPALTGSRGGAVNPGPNPNHLVQSNNVGSAKSLKSTSSKSLKSNSTSATVSSQSSDESASYGNHGSKGSINRASPPPQPAAAAVPKASELGSSAASLNNSQDKNNANTKKSVFSKVMSTLRTKHDPTVAMAFIDPSNPASAFVVDKNAVGSNGTGEVPKPTIVISRKGAEKNGGLYHEDSREKGGSFHTDGRDTARPPHQTRNTKSFHDDRSVRRMSQRPSLPDVQEDRRRPSSYSTKSSQDESYNPKKSTSFYDARRPSTDESCRKTKSFHHTSRSRRSSANPEEHRIDKRTSHNTSLNRSVDIFDNSGTREVTNNSISAVFNYSEPVLPSQVKPKQSSLRPKQAKVQPDTHLSQTKQQQDRHSLSEASDHRRKTLNDVERPKMTERPRRGEVGRALKAYYEKHEVYPPPPPPRRNGSKWCMENDDNHSESDEYSEAEVWVYD